MSFTSDLIKKHEGLRLTAYRDTRGILTIGYGFNLQATAAKAICAQLELDYAGLCAGTTELTQDQADSIFDHQLGTVIAGARITFPGFDSLPEKAQAVIADLIFNLGLGGFLTFRKTIALLKAGKWDAAADELVDSLWFRQVPNRAAEDVALLRAA